MPELWITIRRIPPDFVGLDVGEVADVVCGGLLEGVEVKRAASGLTRQIVHPLMYLPSTNKSALYNY